MEALLPSGWCCFSATQQQWADDVAGMLQGLLGQQRRNGLTHIISVYVKLTNQHLQLLGATPTHQSGEVRHLLKFARLREAETAIRQAPRASL